MADDPRPLSERRSSGPVSRVNTERSKNRRAQGQNSSSGQLSGQDMLALFQAMPVPNRGYKNPYASKPHVMGQGMKWLDENNSPEQVAARQARANDEAYARRVAADAAGKAAVDYTKQTKGYSDENGNFVPPTNPIPPSSKYGTGSVKFYKPGEARPVGTTTDPLTGKTVTMRSFLDDLKSVQDTKYGPGRDENGNLIAGPSAQQAGANYFNPSSVKSAPPKQQPTSQMAQSQPTTPASTAAPKQPSAPVDFASLFPGTKQSVPTTSASALKNNDFWALDQAAQSNPSSPAETAFASLMPRLDAGNAAPAQQPAATPGMMDFLFGAGSPKGRAVNMALPVQQGQTNVIDPLTRMFTSLREGWADMPSGLDQLKEQLGLANKYTRVY